jgi:acyl-CoA reductase-like NAD-dependent aldehyde dehydrogenase
MTEIDVLDPVTAQRISTITEMDEATVDAAVGWAREDDAATRSQCRRDLLRREHKPAEQTTLDH